MTIHIKYLLGLTALFFLTACGSDYLDDAEVFRDLEAATFYQTQADAILAVNAAYTPLQYQGGFRRYPYLLDYMSGDLSITSGGRQLTEYPGFQFNATSQHLVPAKWESMFTGISRANVVLDRVPAIEFVDNDLKERILGEAYFLRGLYYSELVKHYGGVPLYEKPFDGDLSGPGFRPARATRAEVYALIENDLTLAAASLPNGYDNDNLGRATAGAAQAYLGEALLYQEKYAEAAAALKRIIDGEFGDYELVTPFSDNFGAGNENNAESIFEIQYQTGIGAGFSDGDTDRTAESNWMATALNPGLQRAFANGLPSFEVNDFFSEYPEENAVRRPFTIARAGDTWGPWNPIAENPVAANQWRDRAGELGPPYLGVRKGTEGAFPVGFVQSPINFRTMRFAEVLLLFAEAENEANGPTEDAYAAVNRVRARAQVDDYPTGLSKDEFFARLAAERRLELTFEFKRFFDIIRWTRRAGPVPAFAQPSAMPGFTANKNELLPLPENELVANPNLTQNPGY